MNLILTLLITSCVSIVLAFDPSNYCREMHMKCTGSHSPLFKFKDVCERLKCQDKNSYDCTDI